MCVVGLLSSDKILRPMKWNLCAMHEIAWMGILGDDSSFRFWLHTAHMVCERQHEKCDRRRCRRCCRSTGCSGRNESGWATHSTFRVLADASEWERCEGAARRDAERYSYKCCGLLLLGVCHYSSTRWRNQSTYVFGWVQMNKLLRARPNDATHPTNGSRTFPSGLFFDKRNPNVTWLQPPQNANAKWKMSFSLVNAMWWARCRQWRQQTLQNGAKLRNERG